MAASSQPSATLSAVDALRAGGNAIDAAICAAAVLCVTEPHATGVGGDAFAIVRDSTGQLAGLDAAGPAPRSAASQPPAWHGPQSVTVPGAVAGWGELARRFGRFGLDRCLQPAIDLADRGVAAGADTAHVWQLSERAPRALGPAPNFGQRFRMPALAETLRAIADHGPQAVYSGRIAEEITRSTWLDPDDLAGYEPGWVAPLTYRYAGMEVAEMPPPTQGIAVLEALALLDQMGDGLVEQVQAVALALDDARCHVRDGADVAHLISEHHVARRARERLPHVREPGGGTVYLCVVDGDGMAVSLIQSLFEPFGSGVLAPETGVVLQNRGACFSVEGTVAPGRRPYHTIIPGMLTRETDLVGPFGVMGGFIQAQAHVQFLSALIEQELDPQAALDRGRFRLDGRTLRLEEPLWDQAPALQRLGYEIERSTDRSLFGGGQAIVRRDGALFGGSDARKDGCALGC
jgi:gamma-glutamyltranspeptidase/glutathione hydrolase